MATRTIVTRRSSWPYTTTTTTTTTTTPDTDDESGLVVAGIVIGALFMALITLITCGAVSAARDE